MKKIYLLECPSFSIEVLASSLGEAAIWVEKNHGTVSKARKLAGDELNHALNMETYYIAS